MDGQDRTPLGTKLSERLLKRTQRRQRAGLSESLLARFGMPESWEGMRLDGPPGPTDADGMTVLSIRPYLARMQRLAMSRRRRELRLARLTERFDSRDNARAWARWPGGMPSLAASRSPWGAIGVLAATEMKLPPPLATRAEPAGQAEPVAAPGRARREPVVARGPRSSAWLVTPWVGARTAGPRAARPELQVVEREVQVPASAGRAALARVGARQVQAAAAHDPLRAAVAQAAPSLANSRRGRALHRALVELVELPELDRAPRLRRLLKRAGVAARPVTEEIERAVPAGRPLPTRLAAGRMHAASSGARQTGLRPVLSGSPAMSALVSAAPTSREQVEDAPPARPSRAVSVAAARAAPRRSPWLSSSPVQRSAARDAARPLSASPVARSRHARVPAVVRSRLATGGTPRTEARGITASPARPGAVAAGPRRAARAGPDEPGPGPSEPPEPVVELAALPRRAGSPRIGLPPERAEGVAEDLQGSELVASAGPLRVRATARAFERLVDEEGLSPDEGPVSSIERLASSMEGPAPRARLAAVRSPQGVFVPAQTLAAPSAPALESPEPTAVAAPRSRPVPTPSMRATYVQGLPSTARVAPRRAAVAGASRPGPSQHAASRSETPSRPGAIFPSRSAGGTEVARARMAPADRARPLASVRDARGTFVAAKAAPAEQEAGATATAAPLRRRAERVGTALVRASVPALAASPSRWADQRLLADGDGSSPAAPLPRSLVPPVVTALQRRSAPLPSERESEGADAPLPAGRRAPRAGRPAPTEAAAGSTDRATRVTPRGTVASPGQPALQRRPTRRALAPAQAAAERALRLPLVGDSVRRAASQVLGSLAGAPAGRHRQSPLAWARRLGIPAEQLRVEIVDGPRGTPLFRARAPATGSPEASTPRQEARPLDRMDLRAIATAGWVLSASGAEDPAEAGPLSKVPSSWQQGPSASVLSPRTPAAPVDAESGAEASGAVPRPRSSPWGTAGRVDPHAPPPRSARGARLPSSWAGQRSQHPPTAERGGARLLRAPRGRFDGTGAYRVPSAVQDRAALRSQAPSAGPAEAPLAPASTVLAAPARPGVAAIDAAARSFDPGLPGAPRPSAWGRRDAGGAGRPRPDLSVTLGAVEVGVEDRVLPVWARRASGEPLIHREEQLVDALAKASEPEEIVRIIYERAARGGLTSASGLPAPILSVIERIRTVAGQVQLADASEAAAGATKAGPGSDAEVLRRARGERAPAARSTARVASGFSSLRRQGTASRRDGVGTDQISKLSKKLQELILLAERQRGAAREEVRMAEDSAAARTEGQASPGAAEGGNDKHIDIEALGREVLEVVTMELEQRKVRSQEGSDEYGWW